MSFSSFGLLNDVLTRLKGGNLDDFEIKTS